MEFKYHFGDNWRFNIVLEKIFDDESIEGKDLVRVLEWKGLGIIEDCGIVMRLEDIKETINVAIR